MGRKKNPIQVMIVTHNAVKFSKRITSFMSTFKEVSDANDMMSDIFYVDEFFRIDHDDIKTRSFKVEVLDEDGKILKKTFSPTNRVIAIIDDDVMRFAEGQVFVRVLKMKGITLVNDFETSILCGNRYMMYMMLSRYDINTIPCEYVTHFNQKLITKTLMSDVKYPAVVSSNNGSGAVNSRAGNYMEAIKIIRDNVTIYSPIIVQPLIESPSCIRVIALNGNIMASIKTTSFKDNYPDFSNYTDYEASNDEIEFIRSVARAIDVDMGCVDYIVDADGKKTVVSIEAAFTKYGTNDIFVRKLIEKVINNIRNIVENTQDDLEDSQGDNDDI